jgi:3-keto-L-gulonate-6-phosphate decarboxylase
MPAKIYDWERWFGARRFTLHRGRDYDCSHSSMSQQVRNAASARGLRVAVVEGINELTVIVGRDEHSRVGA